MQEEYDAIFRYESYRMMQNPGTHELELVICKPFFPLSRLYSQNTS
jgi:hypothetical protein